MTEKKNAGNLRQATPQQLRAASLVAPGTVALEEISLGHLALIPTTDDTLRSGIWRYQIDYQGNVTYFPVAAQKRQPWSESYESLVRRSLEAEAERQAGI